MVTIVTLQMCRRPHPLPFSPNVIYATFSPNKQLTHTLFLHTSLQIEWCVSFQDNFKRGCKKARLRVFVIFGMMISFGGRFRFWFVYNHELLFSLRRHWTQCLIRLWLFLQKSAHEMQTLTQNTGCHFLVSFLSIKGGGRGCGACFWMLVVFSLVPVNIYSLPWNGEIWIFIPRLLKSIFDTIF